MIKVNFIPLEARKDRGNLWQEGFGSLPREVAVGILAAAVAFLIMLHVVLACLAVGKVAQHSILQAQWNGMSADKIKLDSITSETKALQVRMGTFKTIIGASKIDWSKVLNEISDSVPKGIWLRRIYFSRGSLIIEGSAVSKLKDEMIIANNFVAALKDKPALKEHFLGIDVDSIERRQDTALSVADFSLKAVRRLP